MGKLEEHKYANLQILEVYTCSLMFSYTIKCVTYVEKRLTSWGGVLQRLQGLYMSNVLEENKCNNLAFLSWIDAGDDFKTRVQSCTINATHLS